MTGALPIVQAVVSLSFLALGLSTVIDWLRRRERSIGYLALALGTLGLISILGQLNPLTDYRLGTLIGDITLVLLMTSGYALLLFRDSFIPLTRQLRLGGRQPTGAVALRSGSGHRLTPAVRRFRSAPLAPPALATGRGRPAARRGA